MFQQSLSQNVPANQYNPSLTGNLELSVTQQLLQGFGLSTNRRTIVQAKNNLRIADLNFKEQVIATVKNVIDLYWDFVSLNDNLRFKQKSLEITQKLYEDNRKRAAIGAVAPIDIIQAEAGVQTAELDLRTARTQYQQQELISEKRPDPHRRGQRRFHGRPHHPDRRDRGAANRSRSARFRTWCPRP